MTDETRESPAEAPAGDSTAGKVLAITVPGGRQVRMESDLTWGVLSDIAAKHGCYPHQLIVGPLLYLPGAALEALYLACCTVAGASAPDPLTGKILLESIGWADDPSPDYVDDGLPTVATHTSG